MKNKGQAGDELSPRLLLLLSSVLNEEIDSVISLKRGKWLVNTDTQGWFLKQYKSLDQLKKQMLICKALERRQFTHMISFHPASPIRFKQQVFALMPYISPAKPALTFRTYKEREEALQLLSAFHQTAHSFKRGEVGNLPIFDQFAYWGERLKDFEQLIPRLSRFFPGKILTRSLEMGEWALQRADERFWQQQKQVIVHGDVASHNFFRAADRKLYLIDWDLAAFAPIASDYIQWINRVLPMVNWDMEELRKHAVLAPYVNDVKWLPFLLFPVDIFRECRRFMQLNSSYKKAAYTHAYDLTVRSFLKRERFFQKWKKEWEDI
ncbi:aminoglycoside phosphotransferase family protein [Bacillus thermotolerans]|uniref:Aminoglycoside phosphotransferase domain-containing protein n=1 Tax=Bacillus thermotolerans TaxID=1221996 RepID=A0A0F5HNY9_BACTR|nr:aminoglycoside phosphotransferase family protein [Bacillus thermotolerans]KKB34542.1 hypothetical protein QY97_02270 [Bacillus thermotolerans]KKB43426.1 hypothetical protein QY95_01671 [Bacillus thermotolerans]